VAKAKKRPNVIDGFASVQAVRRAGKRSATARTRPSRTKLPVLEEDGKARAAGKAKETGGARIGQTAMPQKHDIVCYECAYTFVLSGKIGNTICPKCHKALNVGDHKIAKKAKLTVKTIGSVEVTPEGELSAGSSIVARRVVIAGNVSQAAIECTGKVELCQGAELDVKKISFKDLLVRPGSKITITRKLKCRDLEVLGDLDANINVTGTATVKAGGTLRGEISTPHLVVEDGGGLNASVSAGVPEESSNKKKGRRKKSAT